MKWLQKKAIAQVQDELQVKRPLPIGRAEFNLWSERIIQGAMLPAPPEQQKYVLANILVNSCGPTVAFESDLFFINYLRKYAVNQVAVEIREEIYAKKQAAAEAVKQNHSASDAPLQGGDGVQGSA